MRAMMGQKYYLRIKIKYLVFIIYLTSSCSSSNSSKVHDAVDVYGKMNLINGTILISDQSHQQFNKSSGLSNPEYNISHSLEYNFSVGSLTKQFIATAILNICDSGDLSVNDNLYELIPDSPKKWKNITIHKLLTHTSGILDVIDPDKPKIFHDFRDNDIYFKSLKSQIVQSQSYNYSNAGYFLLGKVISLKSGISWEKYLEKIIFQKANLSSTFSDYFDKNGFHDSKIIKNRVENISIYQDGTHKVNKGINPSRADAAGIIISNHKDLHRWFNLLFSGKILSKKSTEMMFRPHVKIRKHLHYGYGWNIFKNTENYFIFHTGDTVFQKTLLMYSLKNKMLLSLNCNLFFPDTSLRCRTTDIGWNIFQISMNKKVWLPDVFSPRVFSKKDLQKAAGTFKSKLGVSKLKISPLKSYLKIYKKEPNKYLSSTFHSSDGINWSEKYGFHKIVFSKNKNSLKLYFNGTFREEYNRK